MKGRQFIKKSSKTNEGYILEDRSVKDAQKKYAGVKSSNSIPKKIHLSWKSKDVGEKYKNTYRSMCVLHPGWDIHVWTDEEQYEYVRTYFPEDYELFVNYTKNVQRFDYFRVAVVFREGGIYLDMDVILRKSLNELIDKVDAFFPCETWFIDEKKAEYPIQVGNYAFGAVSGHPFLRYILDQFRLPQNAKRPILGDEDVLKSTGPYLITKAFHQFHHFYKHKGSRVCLLFCQYQPFQSRCNWSRVPVERVGYYGAHLCFGTWRKQEAK